jgi:hypothetical protein
MLDLADEFVSHAVPNQDLAAALASVRAQEASPAQTYAAYRRTFAEWVSPVEFDIVVQRAVLEAYRPSGDFQPAWDRVGFQRGVQFEDDLASWRLPNGVAALGVLLARLPVQFGHRVLTTNFDPLIEVAVRRAGGNARSLALTRDGSFSALVAAGNTIDIVHLHGYWRPTSETDERALLHDPEQLLAPRPTLSRELADLLRAETVCVVGYSGWDDVFSSAVVNLVTAHDVDVLWALHAARGEAGAHVPQPADSSLAVPTYYGVDSNRLFPALQHEVAPEPRRRSASPPRPDDRLDTPETGASGHRVRAAALERALGAEVSAEELLRQLDREYGWRLERTPGTPPAILYWPVQLRHPTLIYAVQAIVAAALSARGVRVVLCFDDLASGPRSGELRDHFSAEVRRWFALVEGARAPQVVSLEEFLDPGWVVQRLQDPELLHRPTHPWAVEREYYGGGRNVYDIVRAAKVVPDAEAERADPVEITARLTTTRAERLVSTPAIWAYLHYILCAVAAETVLTLGGDDEATMWRQWHQTFNDQVCHLYNPILVGVRQDAENLWARSYVEARTHLENARRNDETWDQEGHYIHWTVQNAVLLCQYLRNRSPRLVEGRPLDSWDVVRTALGNNSRTMIDVIAREVCDLLLHNSG